MGVYNNPVGPHRPHFWTHVGRAVRVNGGISMAGMAITPRTGKPGTTSGVRRSTCPEPGLDTIVLRSRLAGTAFIEIFVLWAFIAATVALFWHRSRWAAILLLPYLTWTTFAVVLNFSVWQLNN